MAIHLPIPDEEVKQFQSFLNIYSKGKTIVQEGDEHDHRIFLLRLGEVEVFRNVGDRQQMIGKIEAVNFFGEISAISQIPRTATIIAASEPVVVYAFEKPNLPAILSNTRLGTLLVKRLTDNLEQMNNGYEEAQIKIDRLYNIINQILGTLLSMYGAALQNDTAQRLFIDSIPKLIKAYMSESGLEVVTPAGEHLLSRYNRNRVISDQLYTLLIAALATSQTTTDQKS